MPSGCSGRSRGRGISLFFQTGKLTIRRVCESASEPPMPNVRTGSKGKKKKRIRDYSEQRFDRRAWKNPMATVEKLVSLVGKPTVAFEKKAARQVFRPRSILREKPSKPELIRQVVCRGLAAVATTHTGCDFHWPKANVSRVIGEHISITIRTLSDLISITGKPGARRPLVANEGTLVPTIRQLEDYQRDFKVPGYRLELIPKVPTGDAAGHGLNHDPLAIRSLQGVCRAKTGWTKDGAS